MHNSRHANAEGFAAFLSMNFRHFVVSLRACRRYWPLSNALCERKADEFSNICDMFVCEWSRSSTQWLKTEPEAYTVIGSRDAGHGMDEQPWRIGQDDALTLITHHCQSTVLCTRLRKKTNMDAPFRCVWTWRPILRSTPKPTPCSRLRPNAWPNGHFVKWEHCERFSGGLKGEMPRTGHRRRRGVDNGEGCPHPQPTSESELRQHGPGSELQPETNLVILLLRVLY